MAEPSQLRRANLPFFAGTYVLALLIYLAVSEALVQFANIDLPSATGLAVFCLAAYYGGRRYAARSGEAWTKQDRRVLALWYSITALILSFLVALPFAMFAPELRALPLWVWLAVAAITPLYAWAQYGIARWAFGQIMKKMPQAGGAQ